MREASYIYFFKQIQKNIKQKASIIYFYHQIVGANKHL